MNEDASKISSNELDVTLYDFVCERYIFHTNKEINNYLSIYIYEPFSYELLDGSQKYNNLSKIIIFIGDVRRLHLCLIKIGEETHKLNLREEEITNLLYTEKKWNSLYNYLWVEEDGKIER